MNAERLLQLFEQVADAPDAIAKLRRLILDLAVRGKLVEQRQEDEPASELMKRIQAERMRFVNSGGIRNLKPFPPVDDLDISFDIPSSWKWTRLGESINTHLGGGTPSKSNLNYWDGDIYWASVKDIGKSKYVDQTIDRITEAGLENSSSNLIPPGNLIVVTRMGLGKVSINRVPMAINQDLRALFLSSYAAIDFYHIFFKTVSYEGTGLTVKGIKVEQLLDLPFPLPPLAEQHRIVQRIDELMALCDQLEAAQTEREQRRDRLNAAAIKQLVEAETGVDDLVNPARHSARFYLNRLPRLTTKVEHIKALRQTILDLAVRGRLVVQDPEDESASILVSKIQQELFDMAGNGKAKESLKLSDIDITDPPFELPPSWQWVRFPHVGIFGRGKSKHRPRNDPILFEAGIHPFVQTGDVARSNGIIKTYTGKYNDLGLAQSYKWPKGTLCITIAANIADSGILDFDACFPDSVVGFIPATIIPSAKYFEYFMRTAKSRLTDFAPATAQKNINLGILNSVLIPLPPLAELNHIVAKVDQLMALCDHLEAAIETQQRATSRLLDTLIAEALADSPEPQAVEAGVQLALGF